MIMDTKVYDFDNSTQQLTSTIYNTDREVLTKYNSYITTDTVTVLAVSHTCN